jgi:hypothetical protein
LERIPRLCRRRASLADDADHPRRCVCADELDARRALGAELVDEASERVAVTARASPERSPHCKEIVTL